MEYHVFYVIGSTRAGDRNAGLAQFKTLDEANEEIESLWKDHPNNVTVVLIEGQEVFRK